MLTARKMAKSNWQSRTVQNMRGSNYIHCKAVLGIEGHEFARILDFSIEQNPSEIGA